MQNIELGVSVLNLAEDMGVIRKGQVTIEKLPFQQDIANMSGTSRGNSFHEC